MLQLMMWSHQLPTGLSYTLKEHIQSFRIRQLIPSLYQYTETRTYLCRGNEFTRSLTRNKPQLFLEETSLSPESQLNNKKVGGGREKQEEDDATKSCSRTQITAASAIAWQLARHQEKEAQQRWHHILWNSSKHLTVIKQEKVLHLFCAIMLPYCERPNLYRQEEKPLLCLMTRELNLSTAAQSYWRFRDGVIASPPWSPTERELWLLVRV